MQARYGIYRTPKFMAVLLTFLTIKTLAIPHPSGTLANAGIVYAKGGRVIA